MNDSRRIKKILGNQHLAPSKKLGQNFLVHRQTAERIVQLSGVGEQDTVVELGVGFGALTQPLAAHIHRVLGLEIDRGILRWHQEQKDLPANVELIPQDLLKADFHDLAVQCGGLLKIMANLPYSVSNPLLFKLVENRDIMGWAVLMLQKEVADRLTAQVGTKEYGILTVLLGSCAAITPLLRLGPEQFHPRPKVDSVVVRLDFHPLPERLRGLPAYDQILLKKVVQGAFQQRRKTILNGLTAAWPALSKERLRDVLSEAVLSPQVRAEKLALEDFIRLTNVLAAEMNEQSDQS